MEQEKIKLFPPQPPPSMEEERKYAQLFNWLKDTKVLVHEDYVGDSKQPIRSLFGKLGLFDTFIQTFIIFKKNKGQAASRWTIKEMAKIISEMKEIDEKTKSSFQEFIDAWIKKFKSYPEKEEYRGNEVLTQFFNEFGNLDGQRFDRIILFDDKKMQNFLTLFSAINSWDDGDSILDELVKTYCEDPLKYFEWYHAPTRYGGGRKLTRRRKSNPKSKSKRKHKRRSYKKSSYRRQRH